MTIPATECAVCGSLVANWSAHQQWHNYIIALAKKANGIDPKGK